MFTLHPSDDPRTLRFTLHKTATYVANAVRRVLIAELVCPGIPNAYVHQRRHRGGPNAASEVTDTDGTTMGVTGCGVHIHVNTGRLHNEILRHRLSMLPLALDPTKFRDEHGRKLLLRLAKACPKDSDAEASVPVTSEDFQLVWESAPEARGSTPPTPPLSSSGTTDASDRAADGLADGPASSAPYLLPDATQLFPSDPRVDAVHRKGVAVPRGVLLTRLFPEEELRVDLHPGVGCAREFAGFGPLHTVTYEPLASAADGLGDFRFLLQTVGAYSCRTAMREGLALLERKVETFRELLQPNTVELDFGRCTHPSLHTVLSTTTRTCWVQWADVDFLTRLDAPKTFYQRHCHEVLAASADEDTPLDTGSVGAQTRVPSVDGEDVVESTDAVRHVLALHQRRFADNGVYEYVASERRFQPAPDAHATFVIAKEGRTHRAQVYTPAEIVQVHDTRCVLRFGKDVPAQVVEHIRTHIRALVCAGAGPDEPTLHLQAPVAVRDDVEVAVSTDERQYVMAVPQEDHTLGNLVQGWVYDQFLRGHSGANRATEARGLVAIGYKQPLPSARIIVFRVEFAKPTVPATFYEAMAAWLRGIETCIRERREGWEAV